MKTLIKLIILLIILGSFAGVGLFFSYEIIDEGPVTLIKTKFRSIQQYDSGTYIFPEKLLFWDSEAFVKYTINNQQVILMIPDLEITLPALTKDKKNLEKLNISNEDFKIKYSLTIPYRLTVAYQSDLILNQNKDIKDFEETFKKYIITKDKGIIIPEIEKLLQKSLIQEIVPAKEPIQPQGQTQPQEKVQSQKSKQPEINIKLKNLDYSLELTKIFQYADQEIIKEIDKIYPKTKLLIPSNQMIHSIAEISISTFENYLTKKLALKALEQFENKLQAQENQLLLKKSQSEAEIKAIHDKERLKLEAEIEKLTMYGKLFKDYPETLNYLYLNKLSDRINILVSPKDAKGFFAPFLPPNPNPKTEPTTANSEKKQPEKKAQPPNTPETTGKND